MRGQCRFQPNRGADRTCEWVVHHFHRSSGQARGPRNSERNRWSDCWLRICSRSSCGSQQEGSIDQPIHVSFPRSDIVRGKKESYQSMVGQHLAADPLKLVKVRDAGLCIARKGLSDVQSKEVEILMSEGFSAGTFVGANKEFVHEF